MVSYWQHYKSFPVLFTKQGMTGIVRVFTFFKQLRGLLFSFSTSSAVKTGSWMELKYRPERQKKIYVYKCKYTQWFVQLCWMQVTFNLSSQVHKRQLRTWGSDSVTSRAQPQSLLFSSSWRTTTVWHALDCQIQVVFVWNRSCTSDLQ